MKNEMKQSVYHHQDYKPLYYSPNDGTSETHPDGTLTIREILERFATGKPIDVSYRDTSFIEGLGDLSKIVASEGGEFLFHLSKVRDYVQAGLKSQSAPRVLDNIGLTDTKPASEQVGQSETSKS